VFKKKFPFDFVMGKVSSSSQDFALDQGRKMENSPFV